ncbi:MAG: cell division protein ZapA [Gammaproteobacteria bacterium]|nr:cell division protein ZapA [Gammaproteobacteria bacterium]
MKDQESLSVNILGKEYRVGCPAEEKESLLASAKMLNEKLNEIKARGSVIGTERIAVMAALNMSHELLNSQALTEEHSELNDRIDSLSEKIDNTMRNIKLI